MHQFRKCLPLFLLSLFFSTALQAQYGPAVGLSVSANYCRFGFPDESLYRDAKFDPSISPGIGIYAHFPLGKRFAVRPELLTYKRRYKAEFPHPDRDIGIGTNTSFLVDGAQNIVEFSFLGTMILGKTGKRFKPYAMAGMTLGFPTQKTVHQVEIDGTFMRDIDATTKENDGGIALGLGCDQDLGAHFRLSFNLRYIVLQTNWNDASSGQTTGCRACGAMERGFIHRSGTMRYATKNG